MNNSISGRKSRKCERGKTLGGGFGGKREGSKQQGKNNKGKEREGQCVGVSEVGVEHKKEIEGFHLPTASLCLSAQRVIKEPANRVP